MDEDSQDRIIWTLALSGWHSCSSFRKELVRKELAKVKVGAGPDQLGPGPDREPGPDRIGPVPSGFTGRAGPAR